MSGPRASESQKGEEMSRLTAYDVLEFVSKGQTKSDPEAVMIG